jgi:hypothetical protein
VTVLNLVVSGFVLGFSFAMLLMWLGILRRLLQNVVATRNTAKHP